MLEKPLIRCVMALVVCGGLAAGCVAQRKDETKVITVWHWMTDRDEALQELARRYKERTGVEVRFELYSPSDVYSQKVIAAAQSRMLPDVYGILDKKAVLASFIKNDYVADLTPYYEADDGAWKKALFEKALDVSRFEEGNEYGVPAGYYGVPIDVTNIQMIANLRLLEETGADIPQTFDEFIETARRIKQETGTAGFVSGWGELWLIDCFASNYAFHIMGQDKVMATYRGEVPYTDPDWIRVFQLFERLRDTGVLVEGIVTKPNKFAEQDFALERAAFAFNGSWCVNVYHQMNPNLRYRPMPPPKLDPDKPMWIWGGAGSWFVVNASSPRREEAIRFLKWLTEEDQQVYLARETLNLPSNRAATKKIPEVLKSFAGMMDQTTHPSLWPVNEQALVIEAFDKAVQSILIGELDARAAAQKVQAVKEREMQKEMNRRSRP